MSRILHITQQGYDQAMGLSPLGWADSPHLSGGFGGVNQVPMYELKEQRRRQQQIGSWPGMIELEIRRHLPTSAYDVFVQRRMNRDSYMARITHGGGIVAEVDVPNILLRSQEARWRTQLCLDLARDIASRGR